MSKPSAEKMSEAGFQFLGRSYEDMDCQEFVERCLKEVGILIDLKGSNAWYRKCRSEGWTGSPEECVGRFGKVPRGAFLFIHAFDGGEEKRGYFDGLGNASHIGIKTGIGKGAIHSSQSRGGVAESEFRDKTIRNGGWNMVGLWPRLSYGEKIDAMLAGGSGGGDVDPDPGGGEEKKVQKATVWSTNGKPVKLRASKKPSEAGYSLYDEVPIGTTVEVLERGEDWSRVNCGRRSGWWMKSAFLVYGDVTADLPGEDEPVAPDPDQNDDFGPGDLGDTDTVEIRISVKKDEAETLLRMLDDICEQLVRITGGLG
jgi:hypothetical protein